MPTYEYKCLDCEGIFEELQSMDAEKLEKCNMCGGSLIRLITGGTGFIFNCSMPTQES